MMINGLRIKRLFSSTIDFRTLEFLLVNDSFVANNCFKRALHETKKDDKTGKIIASGTALGRIAAIKLFPFTLLDKILKLSDNLYICDDLAQNIKWKDEKMRTLLQEYQVKQQSQQQTKK